MNEFTLHINLGDAAMQTQEDIARELRAFADRLDAGPYRADGVIIDVNGNSIGSFHTDMPEPELEP